MTQPVDILAIGVHPDDVELSCSGTLLSQIAQGSTVALLDLTRGELGSRGSAEIRDQEAAAAAKLLGAQARVNLKMADGFFQHTRENTQKIIEAIRQFRPKIVLTNSITDRHPDHGRAAQLTAEACFLSGLLKIESFNPQTGEPQAHHRPDLVLHYVQDYNLKPDFVVDISDYIDQKEALIACYGSQFHASADSQYANEPQTPISGAEFSEYLRARAATVGRPAGFHYGESFKIARPIGIKNLFHLS